MRASRCRLVVAVLSALTFAAPGAAFAQEQIKPYFLLIFDTSDSMLDANKLDNAKRAVTNIVDSQGDVVFGLMRFYQALCPPSALDCPFCDGGTPTGCDEGAELLVGIEEDNQDRLLEWTNGTCDYDSDHYELLTRANTPLAGSLEDARTYFQSGIANDWSVEYRGPGGVWDSPILRDQALVPPVDQCRPYVVVLLTDGRETCNGTPVARAQELQAMVVNGQTYAVPVWVIGFGIVGPDQQLEDVAIAGNTDNPGDGAGGLHAFYPQDDVDLSLALSQIVQDSLLIEVCNGVDDDCDTLIDEGVTNACGTCGPLTEVCNGLDDDCDGQTDEGFTYFCDVPGGHAARDLCADPGETVCDRIDDNCNGAIDEGGICGPCAPGAEVCDNVDNDCDGTVDEDLERPCGTDVGACARGVEVCTAGAWGACSGRGPVPESCNGLDDDCDGAVDGQVEACGIDEGECQAGARRCELGVWGGCLGEIEPAVEICDLLDNDCDGQTDEDDPAAGAQCGTDQGECVRGVFACVDGELGCTAVGPSDETCNLLDDDCDGAIDEGNPGGGAGCGQTDVGDCADGVLTCVNGEIDCVGAIGPSVELCDDHDNDCDGDVDENDPEGGDRCGTDEGECEAGTIHCIGGELLCQDELPPAPEDCNGLDDDCDGAADEGIALGESCGADVGECEPGVQVCVDGIWECRGESGPHDEVCDGLDNDCDTDIDENLALGDECGATEGLCERGREQCVEAGIVCAGEVPAGREQCDCLDNDCDGEVDENPETLCGEGFRCIDCDCVAPCGDDEFLGCPPGRQCVNGYCVGDLCSGVRCQPGDHCVRGECVSWCEGVSCAPGLRCGGAGRCLADDCFNFPEDCGAGQACIGGQCAPHPCAGVECGQFEYCRAGDCVGSCVDLECAAHQRCDDGRCEPDPCDGISCERGNRCEPETGECRQDLCDHVFCPAGHACDPETGDCPEDPCNVTVCPADQVCTRGVCGLPGGDGDDDGGVKTRVLATGGGGCACSVPGGGAQGGASPAGALLLALGLGVVLARRRRGGLPVAVAAAALWSAGCDVDPWCIDCEPEGETRDGGPDAGWILYDAGPDGAIPDAGEPDGCVPGDVERCNEQDDDCDGLVDEGIDLQSPAHCGSCDNVCIREHTFAACQDGACVVERCEYGFWDMNGDPSDGCEYACVQSRDFDTVCDHLDDDCDGQIDEEVDLDTDVDNCGACGVRCRPLHGQGECSDGECALSACDDGWADANGDGQCEYRCTPTGDETCNSRDDDCDGRVDDGNPGGGAACGEATGACRRGALECQRGSLVCAGAIEPAEERCNGQDDDCDGETDESDPDSGRACGVDEGECVAGRETCIDGLLQCVGRIEPSGETCDARDDDCDGQIDEGNPGGGAACGTDVGECSPGTEQCLGGAIVCRGGQRPRLEVCNGLDDDCDGAADEVFDLDADLNNCGACGNACAFDNAFAICDAGACQLFGCDSGWQDENLDDADGCEVFCQIHGTEVCNGQDDDCDGQTDEGLVVPPNLCNPNGECAGATASCGGASGWQCRYGASVDQDADGNIVPERRCDGFDNDCDGQVDEHVPLKGAACGNGQGICRSAGFYVCDPVLVLAPVVCDAPPPGLPGVESCNGLDDDCNGAVDDGIADEMVQVGPNLWMDRYEASRPGATALAQGALGGRACSFADLLPWTDVTWDEADAACAVAGKRLCTRDEWMLACASTTGLCGWSYDDTAGFACDAYAGSTCNGNDYDTDAVTAGNQDGVLPTGSLAHCGSDQLAGAPLDVAFDLSGNVKEWTATDPPGGAVEHVILGGAYNNPAGGLACDFDFTVGPPDFHFPNVGFRCCSDTPP